MIKICRCQAAVGGAFDICFTGKGDAAGAGAVRLFFGFEQGLQNSLANPGFVFDGCLGMGFCMPEIFFLKRPWGLFRHNAGYLPVFFFVSGILRLGLGGIKNWNSFNR